MSSKSTSDGMWKFCANDVFTPPGAMAFTRNLVLMYSIASARVSCMTAPFVTQYGTV
jgi:hypothetical protein